MNSKTNSKIKILNINLHCPELIIPNKLLSAIYGEEIIGTASTDITEIPTYKNSKYVHPSIMCRAIDLLAVWGKKYPRENPYKIQVSITWKDLNTYKTHYTLCKNGLNPQGETITQYLVNNLKECLGLTYTARFSPTLEEHQSFVNSAPQPMKDRASHILNHLEL